MMRVVWIAAWMALMAGASAAQSPFEPGPSAEAQDLREALAEAIARMEADIEEIEGFMRWQADLARLAQTDPGEALRQRLPMSGCLESVLAPLCDGFRGLFRPEESEEVPPPAPGIGEGAP